MKTMYLRVGHEENLSIELTLGCRNFAGIDLSFCDLRNASLSNSCFFSGTFFHTNFSGSDLCYCNFANANLENADFSEAWLIGANFSSARLANARLSGAVIDNETILPFSRLEAMTRGMNILDIGSRPFKQRSAA